MDKFLHFLMEHGGCSTPGEWSINHHSVLWSRGGWTQNADKWTKTNKKRVLLKTKAEQIN